MKTPVSETNFQDLNLIKRGKVRDIYDLGENLLMVATDRISAFDVVMPDPVPDKGIILTRISLYWFEILSRSSKIMWFQQIQMIILLSAGPIRKPCAAAVCW